MDAAIEDSCGSAMDEKKTDMNEDPRVDGSPSDDGSTGLPALASPASADDHLARLRLVHDEVDKQRAALSQRIGNLQTRAAILVGGAGVGLTFLGATGTKTCWVWLAGLLSIIAAFAGVAGIVLVGQKGKEVSLPDLRNSAMVAEDLYSAEWTLVDDKIEAHTSALKAYEWRYRAVWVGFIVLALSWVLATVSFKS